MRESAAAWGAALNMIPSLGPVIEGYLKQSEEGKRLAKAIKDPNQQDFFIQAWQQSGVFRAFFGDDAAPDGGTEAESSVAPAAAAPSLPSLENPMSKPESALQHHVPTPSPSHDGGKLPVLYKDPIPSSAPAALSWSDIVARDAARSSVETQLPQEKAAVNLSQIAQLLTDARPSWLCARRDFG